MANLTDVQIGRELEDNEVLRINYILKRRASKFIAAGTRDALFPENQLPSTDWAKIDDDWFLLPNLWKVGFTVGIMAGYADGYAFAEDEYGRRPGQSRYDDKRRRDNEYRTFENGKCEWAKRRIGKSLAQILDHMRENTVADEMMREYPQQEGMLPPDNAPHEA
jgi:hypothetical protein